MSIKKHLKTTGKCLIRKDIMAQWKRCPNLKLERPRAGRGRQCLGCLDPKASVRSGRTELDCFKLNFGTPRPAAAVRRSAAVPRAAARRLCPVSESESPARLSAAGSVTGTVTVRVSSQVADPGQAQAYNYMVAELYDGHHSEYKLYSLEHTFLGQTVGISPDFQLRARIVYSRRVKQAVSI
jgi:hypothetical protein